MSASRIITNPNSTSISIYNETQNQHSRWITQSFVLTGFQIPGPTHYYSDSLGWSGTIALDWYSYDRNRGVTDVVYAGDVYCSGSCPMESPILEEGK